MGHPVLRAKARALDKAEIRSAAIQKLIDDMLDTMSEYHGVGLAAPQVHEGVRLFVAALDSGDDDEEEAEAIAVINPEITIVGSDVVEDWEGCLSIPDIRGRVPRARNQGPRVRPHGRAHRAQRARFSGAGYPARNRSPRRRALLRSDEVARLDDVPGRICALLAQD